MQDTPRRRLDDRIYVGATFGTLTILAIDNESPRGVICACSKYGSVGRVLVKNLLQGHTKSGQRFPGLRLPEECLVDNDIKPLLGDTKWRVDGCGYAVGDIKLPHGGWEFALLHRYIWKLVNGEIPDKIQIDHINGNRLDNRLENLRLATHTQNAHNARTPITNTSGVKGVSWHCRHKKWLGHVTVNRKQLHIGLFDKIEDAAAAVAAARDQYHGEFACHD